jgi:hypothetical protein
VPRLPTFSLYDKAEALELYRQQHGQEQLRHQDRDDVVTPVVYLARSLDVSVVEHKFDCREKCTTASDVAFEQTSSSYVNKTTVSALCSSPCDASDSLDEKRHWLPPFAFFVFVLVRAIRGVTSYKLHPHQQDGSNEAIQGEF